MGSFDKLIQRSSRHSSLNFPDEYCDKYFMKCKSLYRKDLFGHFGCVNAIEFSKDGRWLVSGGDDRRVLLWNYMKATHQEYCQPIIMKTEHQSNIFCTVLDNTATNIFSAGNDDRVIRHDIDRQEAIGQFHHEYPVYCISLPSEDDNLFATAGEGGAVLVWDVRIPEENKICLSMSRNSFHGVSFNPFESRLIATANAHDGVTLYDLRYPERPVLDYGTPGKRESAMFAKFNQLGTQILALMRRTGPVIYNIHEKSAVVEFSHTDYSNVCTMKNPCFAGDRDQYVAAGSDDFNIYVWENPGHDWNDAVVKEPLMVLEGHRSIVNQVRYNHHAQALASSGVEKVIKLWSQFKMNGCLGSITKQEKLPKRTLFSHEQYMQFIVDSGEPLSHDYDTQSIQEDPRMIAFFDSLVQRVNAGWFTDESSDEESPIDDILLRLANEENIERNVTIREIGRLFRSNRRLTRDRLDDAEDDAFMYFPIPEDHMLGDLPSNSEESPPSLVGLENSERLPGFESDSASDRTSQSSDMDESIRRISRTLSRTLSGGSSTGVITTDFTEDLDRDVVTICGSNESTPIDTKKIPGISGKILGNPNLIDLPPSLLPGCSRYDSCKAALDKNEEDRKLEEHETIRGIFSPVMLRDEPFPVCSKENHGFDSFDSSKTDLRECASSCSDLSTNQSIDQSFLCNDNVNPICRRIIPGIRDSVDLHNEPLPGSSKDNGCQVTYNSNENDNKLKNRACNWPSVGQCNDKRQGSETLSAHDCMASSSITRNYCTGRVVDGEETGYNSAHLDDQNNSFENFTCKCNTSDESLHVASDTKIFSNDGLEQESPSPQSMTRKKSTFPNQSKEETFTGRKPKGNLHIFFAEDSSFREISCHNGLSSNGIPFADNAFENPLPRFSSHSTDDESSDQNTDIQGNGRFKKRKSYRQRSYRKQRKK